jgi:hypothetical protein
LVSAALESPPPPPPVVVSASSVAAHSSGTTKRKRTTQKRNDDDDDDEYNDDDDDDNDNVVRKRADASEPLQESPEMASDDDDFARLATTTTTRGQKKKVKTAGSARASRKAPELRSVVDWMAPVEQRTNVPRNPHFKTLSLPSLKSRLQQFGLSAAGKRETLEARLREFVLRCQINADAVAPISTARIAKEVNDIDFTSPHSFALSRSGSMVGAHDNDLEEAIVVSLLQDQEKQQEQQRQQQQQQQRQVKADEPARAVTTQPQTQTAVSSNRATAAEAVSQPRESVRPTLLQRVTQIARTVDFGEWRVVWSNKHQRPFYFCPRTGGGMFEKPHDIAVDIYELACEEQRRESSGAPSEA